MRKTALITGCSTGSTGHALAKEYHSRGLRVFATARRLESMADLSGSGIELVELDVTNDISVEKARRFVETRLGDEGLDLLVNSAGAFDTIPALDHDIEETKKIFDVNVFGIMRMVQQFFPLLRKSSDAAIVNIGSIVGVVPSPFGSSYSASKAAVHQYSDTLRTELMPFNIRVVTVYLGGVASNATNYMPPRLPATSLYLSIEDKLHNRHSASDITSTNAVARDLVTRTLRTHLSRHIWAGYRSTFVWFVSTFFPRSLIESAIAKARGLTTLAQEMFKR